MNSETEPKRKKSVWARWYMIVAYVVVALVVIGGMSGGGETTDTVKPVAQEQVAKPAAEKAAADKAAAEKAAAEKAAAEKAAADKAAADKAAADKAAADKAAAKKAAVTSVHATEILDEFDGNEAAADLKYKGKTLKVTGIADKVDTEFWDDDQYVIQINGGGDWDILSVNCNDVPASQAARVKVGSPVTVTGTFDDGGDLGVELKDCTLG